nr:type II toxin-antitoxin system RelE/ParE family toxin [Bibersteinia trehalosi]
MYGFAKNQQENVSSRDLADLKQLAMTFSEYSLEKLNYSVKMGKLEEI